MKIRKYNEHIVGEKDGLVVYGIAVDIRKGIVLIEEDNTNDIHIFQRHEVRPCHYHADGSNYERVIAAFEDGTRHIGIVAKRYKNLDGVSMVVFEEDKTNELYWTTEENVRSLTAK